MSQAQTSEVDDFVENVSGLEEELEKNKKLRDRALDKIERGLKDIEEGRTSSWEEVKEKHLE